LSPFKGDFGYLGLTGAYLILNFLSPFQCYQFSFKFPFPEIPLDQGGEGGLLRE